MQEQQEAERESQEPSSGLAMDIALYTLARVGLLVLAAGVLVLFRVPVLVAAAVAVVVVMPLSMLVFGRLRRRVATGMAERTEHRRVRREELRAQLRGERDEDVADSDAADSDRDAADRGRDTAGSAAAGADAADRDGGRDRAGE